jgi:hypothetical protein
MREKLSSRFLHVYSIAIALANQVGLTRKQRFIDIDPSRVHQATIDHNLVPWLGHEQIPNNQGRQVNRLLFPFPYDGSPGTTEQGNAIEGSSFVVEYSSVLKKSLK